jgi:hypothetical protein
MTRAAALRYRDPHPRTRGGRPSAACDRPYHIERGSQVNLSEGDTDHAGRELPYRGGPTCHVGRSRR